MVGSQSGGSVSHIIPVKPVGQSHVIVAPVPSIQVPPFMQVVGVQKLRSVVQLGPLKPSAHSYTCIHAHYSSSNVHFLLLAANTNMELEAYTVVYQIQVDLIDILEVYTCLFRC